MRAILGYGSRKTTAPTKNIFILAYPGDYFVVSKVCAVWDKPVF